MIRDRLYLLPEHPRAGKNHFLNTFEPKIENVSAVPNRPSRLVMLGRSGKDAISLD